MTHIGNLLVTEEELVLLSHIEEAVVNIGHVNGDDYPEDDLHQCYNQEEFKVLILTAIRMTVVALSHGTLR